MDVTSTYKNARISARKARDVAREIQGLPVEAAMNILQFTPRKAAQIYSKTLRTALADAENNFELPLESLYVKEATAGEGPTFRRFKARARGSASAIRKRTAHLRIVLSDEWPEEKESNKRVHVSEEKRKDGGKKEAAPKKKAAKAEKKEEKKSDDGAKAAAAAGAAAAGAAAAVAGSRVDEERGLVYDEAPDEVDDLKEISGVGPVLEDKLNGFGIYTFKQIADWTQKNVDEFDDLLSFKGRIERDEWIKKAGELHKEKHG